MADFCHRVLFFRRPNVARLSSFSFLFLFFFPRSRVPNYLSHERLPITSWTNAISKKRKKDGIVSIHFSSRLKSISKGRRYFNSLRNFDDFDSFFVPNFQRTFRFQTTLITVFKIARSRNSFFQVAYSRFSTHF